MTVTKGAKGAAPTRPDVPAGEILLGYASVAYQVGGTSDVEQSDLDEAAVVRGDYLVEVVSGLTVRIGAGVGLVSDQETWKNVATTVALTHDETNSLWLQPDGTVAVSIDGLPPTVGAVLIAEAVTDATDVTTLTDRRPILDRAILDHSETLSFTGVLTAVTPSQDFGEWIALPFEAELAEVVLEQSDVDGGWTGVGTTVDVFSLAPGAPLSGGGTTVFTNSGTDDERPSIAYDATSVRASTVLHEVRRFPAGTRFTASLVAVPTGPGGEAEQDVRVILRFRRYR